MGNPKAAYPSGSMSSMACGYTSGSIAHCGAVPVNLAAVATAVNKSGIDRWARPNVQLTAVAPPNPIALCPPAVIGGGMKWRRDVGEVGEPNAALPCALRSPISQTARILNQRRQERSRLRSESAAMSANPLRSRPARPRPPLLCGCFSPCWAGNAEHRARINECHDVSLETAVACSYNRAASYMQTSSQSIKSEGKCRAAVGHLLTPDPLSSAGFGKRP